MDAVGECAYYQYESRLQRECGTEVAIKIPPLAPEEIKALQQAAAEAAKAAPASAVQPSGADGEGSQQPREGDGGTQGPATSQQGPATSQQGPAMSHQGPTTAQGAVPAGRRRVELHVSFRLESAAGLQCWGAYAATTNMVRVWAPTVVCLWGAPITHCW